MDINPINMKRIYQSVIEQLIGLIKKGDLKIGDRLPSERALAEMFNVSRASLREAFSAMEVIGIIEVRQGEGTYISDINIAAFINTIAPLFVRNDNMERELLEFRRIIEVETAKLAAKRTKDKGLDGLDHTLTMMKSAVRDNDPDLGARADVEFHREVFRLTSNYILIKVSECVASILESSVLFNRRKILINPDNARILYGQHQKIYEAIRDYHPELAARWMEEHLNFVRKMA